MSLRYALLALLRVGPLSGYDLQKQFSQSVGHVWHAPDSQIYPELRKMASEGLIEPEEQTRGRLGTRRVYHVTDAESARRFFRAHIAQWEAELAQWEREIERIDAVENPMLVRRLAVTADEDRERTIAYKRFAYEGLVDRARGEIAWAHRGLALVDRLGR